MTSSTKANATVITHPAPTYRLAALVKEPGGISEAEMIQRAAAGIERLNAPTLEALDAELEKLAALAAKDDPGQLAIYDVAVRINEIAAVVGFKVVGLAAFSLCNLLEGQARILPSERPAVSLHVETIRLLRSGQHEQGEKMLLLALRKLVLKMQSARQD